MRLKYLFNRISIWLTLFTVFSLPISLVTLEAKSLRHLGKTTKESAPTQEDHAAYFANPLKKGGNPQALRAADDLRLQTIDSIKKLLKQNLNDTQKFELYLRMGELYSERHDYIRGLEIAEFENKYDLWKKKKKKKKKKNSKKPPKISHKRSQSQLLKSADAYRTLVRKYPKHKRTDAALFALAKTLGRLENTNTVLYFKQLIRQHPKSPFIPAAHLALGEFYFDRHKIKKAIKSYKKAMKYKNNIVYPYAVYKLGWAYYNATPKDRKEYHKNAKKSLTAFKLVVMLADKQQTRKGRLDLRGEALKDLVLIWSDTEDVASAWAYFNKLGEKQLFYDMLERLGNTYEEQGKNKKGVATYGRLLREAPNRARNAAIHVKLVNLHEIMNHPQKVVTRLKEMSRLYIKDSDWISTNNSDKTLIAEALEKTEFNMRRMGTLFHKKGQKYKSNIYLNAASDIYAMYLKDFHHNKNAYEIRYYLADIYYHFKRYLDAAVQYTIVAKAKPKDGKYLKDAAYNAVSALETYDNTQKYAKLPPPGQVNTPITIPEIKLKLIEAMKNYIELLPKQKAGFPMRYSIAQTYFDYGHYNDAISAFYSIVVELPKTKQAKGAIKVILAYYAEKKDWPNLIKYSRKFLALKKLPGKKLHKILIDSLKMGVYQLALSLQKEGQHLKAANQFLAYQNEFPKDKSANRALYNAGLSFYKIGDIGKALSANQKLLTNYPKAKIVPTVILDVAQTYESIIDFKNAAKYYEMFYNRFPKKKQAENSLHNCAILYKGLKKYRLALSSYQKFIKTFPRSSMHKDVLYDMALLKEKIKDYNGAIKSFKKYLSGTKNKNGERPLFAKAKIAQLEYLYKSKSKGERALKKVRKKLTRKGAPPAFDARRVVAAVFFNKLEPRVIAFKGLKVRNASRLQRDVKTKQKKLLTLAKKFENIIDIGSGEYTVASLYRLGQMHENFANALFKVKPPSGANQIEIDRFRSSMEKLAFPLKEDAFKYFETAYRRSREVQTFSEWTRKSYKKMTELEPKTYKKILEETTKPGYLSHEMQWQDTLSSLIESK